VRRQRRFRWFILGLTAVVKASTGWGQASPREKTVLELQVENARDIRRALATPVGNAAPAPDYHPPGP
jgi:hypothetical protein